MHGVRIRYKGKKTVLWFADISRVDAVAKAWEQAGAMPREMVGETFDERGVPQGGTVREIPLSDLIVEYVTNAGTPEEVTEPVPFPPPE